MRMLVATFHRPRAVLAISSRDQVVCSATIKRVRVRESVRAHTPTTDSGHMHASNTAGRASRR